MRGNPREESSTFLRHIPCPRCGSSDANSLFSDGHTYCYSCNTYSRAEGDTVEEPKTRVIQKMKDTIPFSELTYTALRARHINEDTCKKFSYMLGTVNGKPCQVANYYNDKGELTGQKLRFPDKTFAVRGHITDSLYGQHLWSGGKKLIITEGEIDCLSVSQIQNNQYPVVSVPNGAQGAKKVLEKNLEYLAKFDEVILMFDMDDAGRKAIEECAKILPVGKAFIANLPCKDPNDCLKEGKTKELISAIWNAKPYRPDGIVAGTELENKCVHELLNITDCVQYPWTSLQNKTRGIRHGELIVLTSGSGMGKSTIMRELEYYLGVVLGEKCGIVALEESTQKTGLELMSIHLNKRISLDPEGTTEEERLEAFKKTVGNGNFYLYDHFGSLDSDNLLSKLRYMAVGLGCKRIFLDHISIVVSGMDSDADGGERKCIDKLMTNLRSFVEETGVTLYVISHLKRPEGKGHEEGGQVSLAQLRGSGGIAQLSDMVIGLERNQQGDNPNVLTLRVLKNRFSGETGVSGHLLYDVNTGRLKDYEDCPFDNCEEF
jgi:twinkle protein